MKYLNTFIEYNETSTYREIEDNLNRLNDLFPNCNVLYDFKNGEVFYQVKSKNKFIWSSLNKKGFPNEKQAIELINRKK